MRRLASWRTKRRTGGKVSVTKGKRDKRCVPLLCCRWAICGNKGEENDSQQIFNKADEKKKREMEGWALERGWMRLLVGSAAATRTLTQFAKKRHRPIPALLLLPSLVPGPPTMVGKASSGFPQIWPKRPDRGRVNRSKNVRNFAGLRPDGRILYGHFLRPTEGE